MYHHQDLKSAFTIPTVPQPVTSMISDNPVHKLHLLYSMRLVSWGVCKNEALTIAKEWIAAKAKFERRKWLDLETIPNNVPVSPDTLITEAISGSTHDLKIIEEAVFGCFQSDIAQLAKAVTLIKNLHEHFKSDPPGFWGRLAKYTAKKRAGRIWENSQPKWLVYAYKHWVGTGLYEDTPPVCLWSDGSFKECFPEAPDEASIRQNLRRAGLIRPQSLAVQIHKEKDKFTWKEVSRPNFQNLHSQPVTDKF